MENFGKIGIFQTSGIPMKNLVEILILIENL